MLGRDRFLLSEADVDSNVTGKRLAAGGTARGHCATRRIRTAGRRARWRVIERRRLDVGVVLLNQELNVVPGVIDVGGLALLGNDPRRHESLRSALDLGRSWRWDIAVRRVAEGPQLVPSYTAVDSRLAWKPTPALEFAFAVQKLLDPGHADWGVAANRVEIEPSCFVQVRLQP